MEGGITRQVSLQYASIKQGGLVMSTKQACREKAEAEPEIAHARIAGFRARAKHFTADGLEEQLDAVKGRLEALGEAGEDCREKLKDGVEWITQSHA